MFELDGDQFDLAAIEKFAKDDNKTTEEYISAYGLIEVKPGKTTPTAPGAVVEETAAPESQATELVSEDISLDSPKTSIRKKTREGDLKRKEEKILNNKVEDIAESFETFNLEELSNEDRLYIQDLAQEQLINNVPDPQNYNFTAEQIDTGARNILNEANKLAQEEQEKISSVINMDMSESLRNAALNVGQDVKKIKSFWSGESPALDLATAAVYRAIFGQENVDEFVEKYRGVSIPVMGLPVSLTKGLGTKEILKSIPKLKAEQEKRKQTLPIIESFKQGEILKGGAAILSSMVSMVGSAGFGAGTVGSGFYADFAAENYVTFNEELAKRENTTLENLIIEGKDNAKAPVALAGIQAMSEVVGLSSMLSPIKKNGAKVISNKFLDSPLGAKVLDIYSSGKTEFITENFQFGIDEYNRVLGKTGDSSKAALAMVEGMASQEGLESGLQGLGGAVGIKGSRYLLKAASNLRAPADNEGIQADINELSELQKQYNSTESKVGKEGIQQKINDVNSRLSSRIIKSNAIIPKLNKTEIDEVNNMGDLANLQVKRVKELNKELDEGNIKRSNYLIALEGYKTTYINAKNRIKGIADSAETKPEQAVAEEIDTQEQTAPLTEAEQAVQKIIAKEKIASSKVQQIYNDKGIDGINEIFNEFKPIVDRIVDKRRDAPNFDRELLTSEIQVGKRGILDLVRAYPKYVEKQEAANQPVAPLAGFINKQLPNRAIEASQRILGKEFTQDVTEAKAVTATETAEDIVTQQERVKQEVKTALAKDLNLDETTQNDIVKAVEKTLGTKLPAVTDKKFKQALTTGFRNELTNTFKTVFGRQASYEQFLRDNFEKIYPAIPQETINRNFKEFNEAVVDPETGKQLREKTAEGKKVFKKRDITKAEFIKYFLNAPGNVKGARKTSLAKVLADEIGLDNVLEALSKEDIKNKFVAVQELQGQEVPANFIEIISEKIDRAINYLDNLQKNNQNLYVSLGIPELSIAAAKAFLKAAKATLKLTNDFAKALKAGIKAAQDLFETKEEKLVVEEKLENIYKKVEDLGDITKIETATEDIDSGVIKIRTFNVLNNSISNLKNNVKLAKTIEEKETAIYNFLKYELSGIAKLKLGKEGYIFNKKSAAVKHAWTWFNEQNVFDKETIKNFKLAESGKFGGRGIFYKNVALNDFEGKYRPSQNSIVLGKSGWKSFYNTLVKQKSAQDNMNKDYSNYLANKIAKLISEGNEKGVDEYLQIMGAASDSALRFAGKIRSVEKGKPGEKLVYEHTPPIKELRSNIKKAIDKNKSKEENYILVKNELNKSFVDFITEKNTEKLNKSGLKEKGTFPKRYNNILNVEKDLEYLIDQKNSAKENATLSEDFNQIIENKTSIAADQVYKKAKAEVEGASKGKWKFFIPPGAEDFVGLLYATLGKGKLGDQQMAWYKYNLLNPYTDALNNITRDRVQLAKDFKELKKQLKIVPKNLRKKLPGTQYSQQDAVRVYIWSKQGVDMLTEENGMDKADLDQLIEFVEKDPNLLKFANQLMEITQGEYASPGAKWWNAGSIDADLLKTLSTTRRAKYLEESGWTENVKEIFSEENLNKLEAAYGKPYRIALENILARMKSGRNRSFGGDALTGRFTDWISNSIGTIMFLNSRSAVLQTISAVNFINWSDNNLYAAAKAFANPKQWSKDFMTLMNSPFLIERRNGLKIDVNESEIADLANTSTNKAKAIMGQLLKAGFLPTQIADSFAIASGGASFYRNRINSLVKAGYTTAEAEKIAMRDFRETATESQQSSDPSRISQQQAGPLGRMVLAFANTPAQYARLTKKAVLDIKNGRGDLKTNISKVIYYMVVQNIIFTALQQALFAVAFGDDEEEDEMNKKYIRMANSMSDSVLRGLGFAGAAVSVAKNVAIKIAQESDKKSPKFEEAAWKLLEISPPISSKISKFRSAGRQISWNRKEIREKGLSLENPAAMAGAQIIAGTTNLPVDRVLRKIDNVQNALSEDAETWQRVALLSGWQDWEIGMKEEKKRTSKVNNKILKEKVKREKVKREKVKR